MHEQLIGQQAGTPLLLITQPVHTIPMEVVPAPTTLVQQQHPEVMMATTPAQVVAVTGEVIITTTIQAAMAEQAQIRQRLLTIAIQAVAIITLALVT